MYIEYILRKSNIKYQNVTKTLDNDNSLFKLSIEKFSLIIR